MAVKIQFRRDLAANWGSSTVLASGEVGYETDTGNIKIGNGSTQWSALAYYQLPRVSVNPATSSSLNAANYLVQGIYRLATNSNSGITWAGTPTDFHSATTAQSTLTVTIHQYTGQTTLTQQVLTQRTTTTGSVKQWVRLWDGTTFTEWTSTAQLSNNEVTTDTIANATSTTDGVTNAKLRHSAALSVVGRSANSVGSPADISTSSSSSAVLRESGGVIGFGTIATAGIADNAVTAAKLADDASVDGNRAVTTNHIRNGAVTSGKLDTNISISGTLSVGTTTTFTGAPSYAADPASANILARKSYVDNLSRIGAQHFVVIRSSVIRNQTVANFFTITAGELLVNSGTGTGTWYAQWITAGFGGEQADTVTTSAGFVLPGSWGSLSYTVVLTRTA